MYKFRNDYSEMAHPNILNALIKYSNEQNDTYGLDKHSKNAEKQIKKLFDLKKSAVYFVSGGTQANMLVISYFLKPYEGVIACDTGHINVHETAAVESSGHKIYTVKNKDGKVTPEEVLRALKINNNEHMVKLKMVYISNSTEIGTIYSKKELEELYKVCKENDLFLFIDGARLSSALTSKENDLKCNELANLCDVFYIGGTKNGLLSGEAIILNNVKDKNEFRYHIKNKGAMLAKGFVLGIQFEEIFKNDLYFKLGSYANHLADIIKDSLKDHNIEMLDSPTNQIFVKADNKLKELLIGKYDCELWEELDDYTIVRIVTSWATKVSSVNKLIEDIGLLF